MKTYNLFLDESGQFIENVNETGLPAIVAGYMVEGEKEDYEEWAKTLFKKTKSLRGYNFEHIDIEHFHAVEDDSKEMLDFITQLVKKMGNQKVKLVCFENSKRRQIVNSDITYLNVFADGLVKLMYSLYLNNINERIQMNVTYAVRTRNDDTNSEYKTIFDETEYTERLKERVIFHLGRLFRESGNNLNFKLVAKDARKNVPLKLADAVCAAFRGKVNTLSETQKDIIYAVPHYKFTVLESAGWQLIKMYIDDNNVADAFYTWCSYTEDKDLGRHKTEFLNLLINKLNSMSLSASRAQFQVLSKIVGALVDSRAITFANKIMTPILNELFPLLESAGFDIARPKFDILFYRLTTATHEGDTAAEEEIITQCKQLQKKIKWTYEDLNYIINYKIRKIEHLKNIFDFQNAENELNDLVHTMNQAKESLSLIDEYNKEEYQDIKSVTLGKIYGSLVGTQSYTVPASATDAIAIRDISNKAIDNFVEEVDILRQYQMRAQAEYSLGNCQEALCWLKKSVKLDGNDGLDGIDKLLELLVKQNNAFGLMHYGKIMEKACLNNDLALGRKLYATWNEKVGNSYLDKSEHRKHPFYIIYGCIGIARAKLDITNYGENIAQNSFKKAYEIAESVNENFTCFAAGLSYEAKSLALAIMNEKDRKKARQTLLKRLESFLNNDQVPPTIKQVFSGWQELFGDNAMDADAEGYKEQILQKALQVPIL